MTFAAVTFTLEDTGSQVAQKNAGKLSKLLSIIVKNRQAAVLAVFVLMFVVEIIEQVVTMMFGNEVHLTFDLFIFLIFVPFGTWLLLLFLKQMDIEREQAQERSEQHTEFSQKLGDARSWDGLVLEIITYPHRLAPEARIALFSINPVDQSIQPEAVCDRDGKVTLKPEITLNPGTQAAGMVYTPRADNDPQSPFPGRYDLPIIHNGVQIGLIQMAFAPGAGPSAEQVRALQSAAPVMGLALEGALLQQVAAEQAAASQAQRQEIAQTLHDTLAQNVGYLRLKLDQLTGENAIREIGAVLQELEQMRSTADEAYQQVRNTLDELTPPAAENLVSTLFKQARAISVRAGFSLRTSQAGKQRSLPAPAREHILYIVREALYNVEKHARASQVHLQFIWLECELIIKITDDGVGFNPGDLPGEGHYGLWIMQQRAQEIGGTITVAPAADSSGDAPGTEITLWVPCPAPKAPAASIPAAQSSPLPAQPAPVAENEPGP